jgi:beta-glucanase (GH16 family)
VTDDAAMMTSTASVPQAQATPRRRPTARIVAAAAAVSLGLTGLTVAAGAPDATAAQTIVVSDSFTRVVSGGWGTAEVGGAWTIRGAKAAQYNVNGSAATIAMGPGDLPNVDALSVVALDTDVVATVSVDRTAGTNSGTYTTLVSRRRTTNEQYGVVLSLATTPPAIQVFRRDSKKVQINIGATALLTGLTYRAGDKWTMRLATSGTNPTTIRVKAWPASSPEPAAWSVTRTDSTPVLQAAGTTGFSAYLSRRATVKSVLVSVYDFAVTATTLCSAPSGLTAEPADRAVALSWSPVAGADGYQVRRNGVVVANPATTSITDSGLTNGTTYAYSVAAVNSLGAGPASAVSAVPMPDIPATPSSFAATAGDARVTLTWSPVAGADGYRVYRDGQLVASPTSASYVSTGLVNGTTYSFAVVATNVAGASEPTAAVSARPMPALPTTPSGLSALPGDRSVGLSWTPVSGATSYDVLRNGAVVAQPTAANVTDTGLVNGTSYSYSVVARNIAGTSAASVVVTATPVAPIPAVPDGLAAVAGDGRVSLTWNAAAGATSYGVYRNGTRVALVAGAAYTDTGLVNQTAYAYSVTSTNASGTSASSSVVMATPMPPVPATPTGLTAAAGSTTVALSWTAVAGATGYVLRRDGVIAASLPGTSYTDTGLVAGTTHSYTVASSNVSGTSAQSGAVSATTTSSSSVPAPPAGWVNTFVDDFTGSTVDATKWNVRNNTYNNNEQSYLLARNVSVANGMLNVTAKKESVGGKAYSSGYLDSIGKFSQRYGIWQVRAKVNTPLGTSQGIWPAPLWLRGDTSPMEIDLIETWGTGATVLNGYRAGSGSASIHQNTNGGQGKVSNWLTPAGVDLSAAFHLYEVEWAPDFISVRIDGVEKVRATPVNASWAFSGTDFLGTANMRINLQVSKDDAYYGGPIASTTFPTTMQVDYIRVMTKA